MTKKTCKKPGCKKEVKRAEMTYCSAECAPFSKITGQAHSQYPHPNARIPVKKFQNMAMQEKIGYLRSKEPNSRHMAWVLSAFERLYESAIECSTHDKFNQEMLMRCIQDIQKSDWDL